MANRNFKIGEIKIKKETYLTTPTSLKLKAPSLFEDPESFNIDRFLQGKIKGNNNLEYIPFSAGSRACPGVKTAKAFDVAFV